SRRRDRSLAGRPGLWYQDLVSKASPTAPMALDRVDAAGQPLAILYTSGTMGKPKGVALSHRNIVTTARATAHALRHPREARALGAVPLFTIFGVQDRKSVV